MTLLRPIAAVRAGPARLPASSPSCWRLSLFHRARREAMKIQEVKSPGGITAWLVEEHSVPLIAMRFAFEGGSAQDPAGKEGLANFLAGMLDEGAGDLTAKQFQERMEEIAMRMSFEDARDAFYGSFETLTENRDKAVALLALALGKPRFDADAVERMRGQLLAGLAYAARDPNRVASEQWMAMAFAGHPYGRPANGTPASVQSITPRRPRRASGRAPSPRTTCAWWWSATSMPPTLGRHARHRVRRSCRPRPSSRRSPRPQPRLGREAEGDRDGRAAVGGALRPARHAAQGQGLHAGVRAQHHPRRRRHVVAALRGGAREARPRLLGLHQRAALQAHLDLRRRRRHQERGDRASRST